VDLSLDQQMDVPFVRFVLNRSMIARYGLRPGDVADAIETSLAGSTVGRIFDRGTSFDLTVKFDPATGSAFERLRAPPITPPSRSTLLLASLCRSGRWPTFGGKRDRTWFCARTSNAASSSRATWPAAT